MARAARVALAIVLGLSLATLVVLGLRINQALGDLKIQASDNLHWNLSQLEVDLVRLNEEVSLALVRPDQPLTELRRRYDLFYSRARNAIEGAGYSGPGFEDLSGQIAELLRNFLDAETPVIDGPEGGLRGSLVALSARIETLRTELRKDSIQMIERLARLGDERRAAFSALVQQVALAALVAIAILAILLVIVARLNRAARREAQHTAQMSRQLAATVNSALDAIVVFDGLGRILQFNPSAEAILGYSREHAIGRKLADLIIPPAMRAEHEADMARLRAGGTHRMLNSGRFQTLALNSSGRELPIELSVSSAGGEQGEIFVAFLRDISDRLSAEAALMKARDDALGAERAKTEFLAVMSHEMRTPLNGVIASLDLAAQSAEGAETRRFITLAADSAQILLRHANDVLDITRMEGGRLHLSEEPFDLHDHVSRLVEAARPQCDEKGISLTFHAMGAPSRLRGDAFRLGQIVQNFLSNAIKFVETGGITVEAEVQDSGDGMGQVEVRVTDTGLGIAQPDQTRIFDDFVMVDPTFKRAQGGAGLGLAISRRLAHAMGGEVGVESDLGEGSCFWLQVAMPLAGEASPVPAMSPLQNMPDLPMLRVLVVEDNAINRTVLEEMLRRLGQSVTLAANGAIGASLARDRRFDVILMDISMPVMDGMTATRLIRRAGASSGSQIVALTAHSLPSDLERIRASGMDDVLVKPISTQGLVQFLAGVSPGLSAPAATPPAGADLPILDAERIADLRDTLGPEGFARSARAFLSDTERHIVRLNQHPSAPDDDPAALCHEAAGLAAIFGARRLWAEFARAEGQFRQGRAKAARSVLDRAANDLLPEVRAALQGLSAA